MPLPSRPTALALLCALALGLAVVGAALVDPTRWLTGAATVDSYGSYWFQWWVADAWARGASPLHADVLFHPWGKDLLTHTGGNLLDVLALLPVRAAFGPAVAWNTLAFAAVATNALAAALWARRLGAGIAAVLAAEVFAGLHPFVLNELAEGRPTQALLAPLLLALLWGDEALATGGRGAILRAAAALALAGWIYWYAAAFGALALCVLAVRRPLRVAQLLGVGLGSLALTAPLVVPLALALAQGDVPGILPLDRWLSGVQTFTNAEGTRVQIATLGLSGRAGLLREDGWTPGGVAFGVTALLATLGAPRRWLAVGAFALALALGPFPFGVRNPVYLGLVALLPPLTRLYWPVRSVAVLVGVGVVGLVTLLARAPARWRPALAGLVALGVLGEGVARGGFPLDRWHTDVPAAVACIGEADGAGIVLPYGTDQVALVWQTTIGAPMLNGMAERSASLVPAEQRAFRKDNTWIRAVTRLPADPRADLPWTEADKAAVAALGYRWVVLRPGALAEMNSLASGRERLRATKRALLPLLGAPVLEHDDAVVYAPWGGLDRCR